MSLVSKVNRVKGSFGLAHQTNLGVLRHYIKTTREDELEEEIKTIKDGKSLRILWEAGLSLRLQGVVLEVLKGAE